MEGSSTLFVLLIVAAAVVLGTTGVFMAVRGFYQVPEADEALVKTGGAKPVVSTGGGLWVIPLFHKVTRVSLQAIRVPIDRTGHNAVPSLDMIPAEIRGEMFVQINPQNEADIIQAVQSLGTGLPDTMSARVREKIDSQVTDALRTSAFRKSFLELNSQKKEFADEVVKLLQEDLNRLGLTLTAVSVTHVSQGPFTSEAGDVIAAQGRRNVAETVERNRQQTNRIEREAQVTIQEQDVEAREKTLALEYRQKQREADNARQVAEYEARQQSETRKEVLAQIQAVQEAEATQTRAVREKQLAESEAVEAREIAKAQAIAVAQAQASRAEEEARIAKDKAVEAARIAKQKEIEAAAIDKERAVQVAQEQRTQAIETAEVERQKAVAAARAEEAAARAAQAKAEATQREAEEGIVTVREVAEADRAKQVAIVRANESKEREQIAADQDAYVQTKRAEAERDAALKRAEAVKAEADGRAEARAAQARGEADALRISAEAYAADKTIRAEAEFNAADQEAAARKKLAEAVLEEGRAQAEARRVAIEAENAVAHELLLRDVALRFLEVSPAVVRELMAPVANVAHDVKILQVQGLGGSEGSGMGLPGEVMRVGLASAGALPFLREAWEAVKGSVDGAAVQEAVQRVAASVAEPREAVTKEAEVAPEEVPEVAPEEVPEVAPAS